MNDGQQLGAAGAEGDEGSDVGNDAVSGTLLVQWRDSGVVTATKNALGCRYLLRERYRSMRWRLGGWLAAWHGGAWGQ